jgi:hypothetical protein
MVPKERFELSCPYGHYALNVARLPFRHFGCSFNFILSRVVRQLSESSSLPHLLLTGMLALQTGRRYCILA